MSTALRSQFESLHMKYYSMVLNLCRGFVKGDRDQALDLCQEVFVNTWNSLPSFRGESSEKTWIYRITINTCLMWIRKEKSKAVFERQGVYTEAIADNPSSTERHEQLYQAIGKLEEVDRLVIMMVLDELEYDEISRVLGITENNLRVKVHRIRQRLKSMIK
jgi:RNA polymerase sigma factor (sigma-70 family)